MSQRIVVKATLEQQRDGAKGMEEELYPRKDNLSKNSDWLGGDGNGWERVPYYVKALQVAAFDVLFSPIVSIEKQKRLSWCLTDLKICA